MMTTIPYGVAAKALVTALLLAIPCSLSFAQPSSGGVFTITKHTIDNGGGRSQGVQFTLTGTIGQPEANEQPATGGQFSLRGGFWSVDQTPRPNELFEDGFED